MRNFIKRSKINNGNRFIFCRRENRRLNRYPFDLLGSINVKKKKSRIDRVATRSSKSIAIRGVKVKNWRSVTAQ